jgi:hypothetical protein
MEKKTLFFVNKIDKIDFYFFVSQQGFILKIFDGVLSFDFRRKKIYYLVLHLKYFILQENKRFDI